MTCNRCGKGPVQWHQKVYGDAMEKEILFCERCLKETLMHDSALPSKTYANQLNIRNGLIEDHQFTTHALQGSLIFHLLFPQAFLTVFSSGEPVFDEKRWGKLALQIQFRFFKMKLQKAEKNENYAQASHYKEIMQRIVHSYRRQYSEKWGSI